MSQELSGGLTVTEVEQQERVAPEADAKAYEDMPLPEPGSDCRLVVPGWQARLLGLNDPSWSQGPGATRVGSAWLAFPHAHA